MLSALQKRIKHARGQSEQVLEFQEWTDLSWNPSLAVCLQSSYLVSLILNPFLYIEVNNIP